MKHGYKYIYTVIFNIVNSFLTTQIRLDNRSLDEPSPIAEFSRSDELMSWNLEPFNNGHEWYNYLDYTSTYDHPQQDHALSCLHLALPIVCPIQVFSYVE